MLKYKEVVLITIILFASSITNAQTKWKSDFYNQAPTISIIEEEGIKVGSLGLGESLQISLTDVGQLTGHICPGTACGFLLTRLALIELFPNETPKRGNIKIASMSPNGIANIAAYIVGIHPTDLLSENPNLIIDKSLKPEEKGKIVLIFQRKDNGKMVKASFNKMKLITQENRKILKTYMKNFEEGKATNEEIEINGKYAQSIVKRLITETPGGVLLVKPCTEYKFNENK